LGCIFGGQRPLVPLLQHGPPFYPIILFVSTTILTGVSLYIRWPLTSQVHGGYHHNFFLLRIKLHIMFKVF
jgi:hypothetical protein